MKYLDLFQSSVYFTIAIAHASRMIKSHDSLQMICISGMLVVGFISWALYNLKKFWKED